MFFLTNSEQDTIALGLKLGSTLNTGDTVILSR